MELTNKIVISEGAVKVEFRKFCREYLSDSYRGRGGIDVFCKAVKDQLGKEVRWHKGQGKSKKYYLENVAPREIDDDLYKTFRERFGKRIEPDRRSYHQHFFNMFLACVMLDPGFESDAQRKKFLMPFGLESAVDNKATYITELEEMTPVLFDIAGQKPFNGCFEGMLNMFYFNPVLTYPIPNPGRPISTELWTIQEYVRKTILTIIGDSNEQ